MTVIDLILIVLAAIVLVPLAVLTVECCAALFPARRSVDGPRSNCAILVPAHDEEAGLTFTLTALQSQLIAGDRLLVIADNCTDNTAAIARAGGAEVLERRDAHRRGKGYALAAGVDALRAGPPDVVVIVDADCRPGPGAIDRLVRSAATGARPIQAAYVLDPPANANVRSRLSAWAVRFKNVVRPRGLRRLGLPCLLTGSGMAFPWRLLRDAPLASGHIVEDMQLGIDQAISGRSPQFEPLAIVAGELPLGRAAAFTQRTRWEHGHLGTLLRQSPRLLLESLKQRRLDLAGLALELSVPPLSVLALIVIATLGATLAWAAFDGSWWPGALLLGGASITTIAGMAAWMRFGRDVLSPIALLAVPFYVAWKLPLYVAFLFKPQRAWVRTPRSEPPPAGQAGEAAQ